jgi:hypothetical protein
MAELGLENATWLYINPYSCGLVEGIIWVSVMYIIVGDRQLTLQTGMQRYCRLDTLMANHRRGM